MPRDCLITSRVAGPCASCRQPAWPAHVQGLLIYCEACCGCGRGGGPAGPAREAGPDHDALAADRGPSENMPGIGLPAGAGASQAWGKAPDTTQRPARDSGALEALRQAWPGPRCLSPRTMPRARATGVAIAPERGGKAPDTAPPAWPAPPRGLQTQVCAAHSAAKRFRVKMFWRKLYD
jgi:hypothetical protein